LITIRPGNTITVAAGWEGRVEMLFSYLFLTKVIDKGATKPVAVDGFTFANPPDRSGNRGILLINSIAAQ